MEGARRSSLVRRFRHASVARNESAGTRREDHGKELVQKLVGGTTNATTWIEAKQLELLYAVKVESTDSLLTKPKNSSYSLLYLHSAPMLLIITDISVSCFTSHLSARSIVIGQS